MPGSPYGLAFDGEFMWASVFPSVIKLRISDGAIVGDFYVSQGAAGIAFDGANMWVVNYDGADVSKL